MKSTLLSIHFFVREKNIEINFPQSKNERIPDTKRIAQKNNNKKSKKDDTKTRHPQMIFYGKKSLRLFWEF